ncbi:MAG TPA: carbonate dehydratase [Geoalkalibacter subterraneus]|uniref:Carbonic anhydrase n=1 Tax=Geoalkalibacter subterraneus TaxID=483547 RepID=A0A831PNM4_9BACT|nr:carbonate dehydratase [Geoalkalibacter subterraneus]
MKSLEVLFNNNRRWAASKVEEDPEFFKRLQNQQAPRYLWIGCADSRVPANEICGLDPGEMFVHRNVANVVVHSDVNCLSVIQYAVEVLKVEHIIVCGHYGCGGVNAALGSGQHGLIDNWLRHIKDVYYLHRKKLESITDEKERMDRLCEINVAQQVANVCHTTIVQNAWQRGQKLHVHGWLYHLEDGLLNSLDLCIDGPGQIPIIYRMDSSEDLG